ncbi:FAD-dependent oxidoreductase [soil metagenome]
MVGAGPIGLSVACHLRRLGVSVRVADKRFGPSEHSKAIGLQYRVSEVLARLGVVDRFLAEGTNPTAVNIYAEGTRLVQLNFVAPAGISGTGAFEPRAIILPQSRTEALLIEYLQELGGAVEWRTELLDFVQSDESVVARMLRADGAVLDIVSSWLVSCEGAHSVVRKQSDIGFHGKTYPLAFFMADVKLRGSVSHEENHVWLHRSGSLAALPLPGADIWRLFIEVDGQKETTHAIRSVHDIERFLKERAPGLSMEVVGEPLWLSDFRINCRMVDRMRDRRVFLAGDAAHIHSPTGGQGITTGMQDAANLSWKLARVLHGAPDTLLDTYAEERLPHAAEVLRETDRTTSIFFAPNPALRLLRDTVVLPVLRSPWVQRRMFAKFSQLHVHYRRSSLSHDSRPHWAARRTRAGDRAPDVTFRLRDGDRTTLFALMRGLRPIVLLSGERGAAALAERLRAFDVDAYTLAPAASTGADLTDVYGDFAALYALKAPFGCVIRPDGHIGCVLVPRDEAALLRYLAKVSNPEAVAAATHIARTPVD